jgi:hypothetical protein
MDDGELNENGKEPSDGVLRFESLDTGDEVLVHTYAAEEGQVSLAISHEMDGDMEVFMDPKTAEDLALFLARAADAARGESEGA